MINGDFCLGALLGFVIGRFLVWLFRGRELNQFCDLMERIQAGREEEEPLDPDWYFREEENDG